MYTHIHTFIYIFLRHSVRSYPRNSHWLMKGTRHIMQCPSSAMLNKFHALIVIQSQSTVLMPSLLRFLLLTTTTNNNNKQ